MSIKNKNSGEEPAFRLINSTYRRENANKII